MPRLDGLAPTPPASWRREGARLPWDAEVVWREPDGVCIAPVSAGVLMAEVESYLSSVMSQAATSPAWFMGHDTPEADAYAERLRTT